MTPELSVEIQEALGADIMMALDVCPAAEAGWGEIEEAMATTLDWARRCLEARRSENALFGIVQGGLFEDLRRESAGATADLPFEGFAIGGVSVGESREEIDRIVDLTAPLLPAQKPRYLMGVGSPRDLVVSIGSGVDMFDCVIPTRNARNGLLFTWKGAIHIKRAQYAEDALPVDEDCGCPVCRKFSRAYLRHLFMTKEILSMRLNTLHNVHFYMELMKEARLAIEESRYEPWARSVLPGLTAADGK